MKRPEQLSLPLGSAYQTQYLGLDDIHRPDIADVFEAFNDWTIAQWIRQGPTPYPETSGTRRWREQQEESDREFRRRIVGNPEPPRLSSIRINDDWMHLAAGDDDVE